MADVTRLTKLDELPELCRVEEVSAWAGCGKGTIYSMVASGALPSVKLGRLTRIPREALAEMVKK